MGDSERCKHSGLSTSQNGSLNHNEQSSPSVTLKEDELGFDIQNPVELLFLFVDEFTSTENPTTLHDWQIQFMMDFADSRHCKESPFKANVRACNGSGKDWLCVAACAVWLCMRFKNARAVATNGSGVQLDEQTELHIKTLCHKINTKMGGNVWKCNYREYTCLLTSSIITLFATDEENKAEGFHPISPGSRFAIFASEAKAITDNIFTALARCNGFTHRVNVSSPGASNGFFFEKCGQSLSRKKIKDIKSIEENYIEYYITAYDCPHITPSEIRSMADDMPGGENGDAFKSSVLAMFGSGAEMVVIGYSHVWKACKYKEHEIVDKWVIEEHNKAGLDLADTGANNVLAVRNGNRLIKLEKFKFDNFEDSFHHCEDLFEQNGLNNKGCKIFGDYIGIGGPILVRLKKRGWPIHYIDSRKESTKPKTYYNLNSQNWFEFAKWLQLGLIILLDDKKLIAQLSNRLYKINNGTVHQILSKLEMKNKKYPSPDEADATIYSFHDFRAPIQDEPDEVPVIEGEESKEEVPIGSFDLRVEAKSNQGYRGSRFIVNGGQTDFSSLEEEISHHNRLVKITRELKGIMS